MSWLNFCKTTLSCLLMSYEAFPLALKNTYEDMLQFHKVWQSVQEHDMNC